MGRTVTTGPKPGRKPGRKSKPGNGGGTAPKTAPKPLKKTPNPTAKQPLPSNKVHKLKARLKEAEERFKNTFEHAGVGIAHADLEGRFIRVNRTFLEMLGYETGELLGRRFHEITHPDDLAEDVTLLSRLMAGRVNSFTMEKRYIRKNGSLVWVSLTVALVAGVSGRPGYFIAVIQDISEGKAAAEALRRSEARLREAQSLAHIGSWELDSATQRLEWTDEIYRIFEIDKDRFGASYEAFLNAIHPDDREMVDKAYRDSLNTGKPYDVNHRLLMPDGRIKYVRESCDTVFGPEGRPLRSVGTVQDITPMKLAEDKIVRALREKEVLLREVHHRVKNNMQIISSLQQLQARKLTTPEAAEAMQDFHGRIRSMSLVHERLYESSDLSHVDVADYLLTLVQNITYSYGVSGIEAAVNADSLSLDMDCLIPLGLIVNELVTNAIKHAFPQRMSEGHITVSLKRSGQDMLRLSVSDDGVGMPEGVDFEKAGTLGLMIVRALAAQIEGRVSITRTNGTGVTIEFPESGRGGHQ